VVMGIPMATVGWAIEARMRRTWRRYSMTLRPH
jgi:hypothetical protein